MKVKKFFLESDKFDSFGVPFYSLCMARKNHVLLTLHGVSTDEVSLLECLDSLSKLMSFEKLSSLYLNTKDSSIFMGVYGSTELLLNELLNKKFVPNQNAIVRLFSFNDLILDNHEEYDEKRYIVFNEIRPEWEHPELHQTIQQLHAEMIHHEDYLKIKRYPLSNNKFVPIFFDWGVKQYQMKRIDLDDLDIFNTLKNYDAVLLKIRSEENNEPLLPKINSLKTQIFMPLFLEINVSTGIEASLNLYKDILFDGIRLVVDEQISNKDWKLISSINKPLILTQAKSLKRTLSQFYSESFHDETIDDPKTCMIYDLLSLSRQAYEAGIDLATIILSPGFNFNKSAEEKTSLLNELEWLKQLGFPLCVEVNDDTQFANLIIR